MAVTGVEDIPLCLRIPPLCIRESERRKQEEKKEEKQKKLALGCLSVPRGVTAQTFVEIEGKKYTQVVRMGNW